MPALPLDYDDLDRELDAWGAEGRSAAFWWRDDDASEPTPALARLLELSEAAAIEVAIAVVPAAAGDGLGAVFDGYSRAVVLQHGYAHKNHAPPAEPAIECGGDRPVGTVVDELRAGKERLEALFGDRFHPILAAPWNRIDRPVLDRLVGAGFHGASAYGPRAAMSGAGLAVANAHVDPLNWRERRFAGRDKALSGILGELKARRNGATDREEPLGLLTHHLDHDAATWAFLERLFVVTAAHSAARWLTTDEAFGVSSAKTASRAGIR